jgi:hypothetical protein
MSDPVRTYVAPPPLQRNLSQGMSGADVLLIQQIMLEEGFFDGTPLGNFGPITEAAVLHFQGTHIGEDGQQLTSDGEVGPKTWWALHNPNGPAQRNYIPTEKKALASGPRAEFVAYLYAMHARGIQEIPDGSNYGDGVTAIVNACGFKYGIYWCLAAQSYAWREVFGSPLLGAMHVGCATFWNVALEEGMAHPKKSYTPIPGDIAIYNYGGGLLSNGRLSGSGHAAGVARVSQSGSQFNALEGNVGNRFKHSIRAVSESTLVGFVNGFGDEENPPQFERGVTEAPVVTLTLAGSR